MKVITCVLAGCVFAAPAAASELIYTPVNPTFGGSPLNSTQLMTEASAQKPSAPTSSVASMQQSTTQEFIQMLQSQLYASLANSVANAITGSNAQTSGTIKLSGTTLSWYQSACTSGTSSLCTNITMTDPTGQLTEITVPVFSR
jgi:curli production assembly/transport component CsgF